MKKILYCASTLSHIRNFHIPYLQEFKKRGYEVWVAADSEGSIPGADHVVALPFAKSFLSFQNLKAIFRTLRLLKQQRFDIVSTHTALASAIIRAAVLLLRKRPRVFCTVHGYLFHETDGLKKWVYLLPEKICARVTNVLMVMNQEDYKIAERHRLYKERLVPINGMGIDLKKFFPATPKEKNLLRMRMGFTSGDFLFVYAAEFSKRKNQVFLIRAFASACQGHPNMKLLLAGEGKLLEECKSLVHQLHQEKQIQFLGYVANIRDLYAACDACVSSSRIEGLPFNIMEAMACGLPVVASDIKGHQELILSGETGVFYRDGDLADLQTRLKAVWESRKLPVCTRARCTAILKPYELHWVLPKIFQVYGE